MNFEDFYNRLTDIYNNMTQEDRESVDVVIPVDRGFISVGRRQNTKVKHVGMGFDWNAGCLWITPEEKVNIASERTKVAETMLNRCTDSYAMYRTVKAAQGDKRALTDAIKRHFQRAVDELGLEEQFDELTAETQRLMEKAAGARKKAQEEKEKKFRDQDPPF